MPYIPAKARIEVGRMIGPAARGAGELNYQLTEVALAYLENKDRVSYQDLNDVMGAFEGAKAEFYRRVVVPYENQKIIENDDIYEEVLEQIKEQRK